MVSNVHHAFIKTPSDTYNFGSEPLAGQNKQGFPILYQ